MRLRKWFAFIEELVHRYHRQVTYGVKRASDWYKYRRAYLKDNPNCKGCGTTEKMEVHHIIPVHKRPDLEKDPRNFIGLCMKPGHE